MKNFIFIFLLAIASCTKDYKGLYDKDFIQFGITVDYASPNYNYEAKFGELKYEVVRYSPLHQDRPGIPKSMLNADGSVTGPLEITPIYLGVRQKPVVFNVTIKAGTEFRFRQAIGDELRMISKPEDEARYTTFSIQQMTDWSRFFAPKVTFNGELIDMFSTNYIPKDKTTGTFRFYQAQGNNLNRFEGKFDTSIQKPESMLENYTIAENETLMLAKAVGSPMLIWNNEVANQYTTLNVRIVYGSASGTQWHYTYKNDWMSGNYDNYVLKNNLADTVRLYKITNNEKDTTLSRVIPGPFQEGQTIDFIVNGDDMIPNLYDGPPPSSRSHVFLNMGYKRGEQGAITIPAVKVKVFLAKEDAGIGMHKVKLLKEVEINSPSANGAVVYADAFETNTMDVVPAGTPEPAEELVLEYIPNYIVEVTDPSTGNLLASRTLDVIQYFKLKNPNMVVWPLALSYKLLNFIIDGNSGDIAIAYGSGAW